MKAHLQLLSDPCRSKVVTLGATKMNNKSRQLIIASPDL